MTRVHHLFLVLLLGFVVGIALAIIVPLGVYFSAFLFSLGAMLFAIFQKEEKRAVGVFAAILFLGVALGTLRVWVSDQYAARAEALGVYAGQEVLLSGTISDEPDVRAENQRLTVDVAEVDGEAVHGRVLVVAERYPAYAYGDQVSLRGTLVKPKNFSSDDTGRVFDYVSFLAKDGITHQMFYPEVLVHAEGGRSIAGVLFREKQAFLERVSAVLPEPHSSLVGGLVVGAKRALPEDLLNDFRTVGIIHIVVLSGYNVTIVAEFIMRFFARAPRRLATLFGAGSIIAFALMTGAGATVVRASIMALIVVLGRATGRTYEMAFALFLAGFFMLLHNPYILLFDPSFQLSFLATLGLIYLAPLIARGIPGITSAWGLRDIVAATIATQIFVLPLLLYQMGELSIVAVPVNVLILPLIPFTMLFGFLAGTAALFHTLLSLPFALIAYVLLSYELLVVDIFARLPFAAFSVPAFPAWVMAAAYAAYGVMLGFVWRAVYRAEEEALARRDTMDAW